MTANISKYDPWGPVSATLFSTGDADLVQTVIEYTGVRIEWPILDEKTGYSHKMRIRAFRPYIHAAYSALADEEKGYFAQAVAKRLLAAEVGEVLKREMRDSLSAIGWAIAEDGVLTTVDALLIEQFFPAGTEFDAYIAIRSIIEKATQQIMIVDAYLGGTIFVTLRASPTRPPIVKLLTTDTALKPDFELEAAKFRQQFPTVTLEVRTTREFHDRFIIVDQVEYYHVGASIKDAGKRAFLISRLQDQPVIALMAEYIESAWRDGSMKL